MKFEAGKILVFTEGDVVPLSVRCGFLVSLKPLDLRELAKKYVVETKKTVTDSGGGEYDIYEAGRPRDFPQWLVSNHYAAPVEFTPVHVGAHDEWSSKFRELYPQVREKFLAAIDAASAPEKRRTFWDAAKDFWRDERSGWPL